MSNKKGFTLIEVLVVVFIVGLLASVVLVGLGSSRARARDTKRIAELRSVQLALESYYAKFNKYPDKETWAADIIGAGIGISNLPQDPVTEDDYLYGASSNNQSYVVGAILEDSGSNVLRNDEDGTVFGVNCDDAADRPVYCIKF